MPPAKLIIPKAIAGVAKSITMPPERAKIELPTMPTVNPLTKPRIIDSLKFSVTIFSIPTPTPQLTPNDMPAAILIIVATPKPLPITLTNIDCEVCEIPRINIAKKSIGQNITLPTPLISQLTLIPILSKQVLIITVKKIERNKPIMPNCLFR
ncbi:MAG: hypothetical protein ACK5RE_05340 [Pseudanabaena sp.]